MAKKQIIRNQNEASFSHRLDLSGVGRLATHHLVVPLYATYELEGTVNLLMPFYKDGDLAHYLRSDKGDGFSRSSLQCFRAMHSLSQAVRFLHTYTDNFAYNKTGIHLDIRPSNIYLKDGRLLLADFGMSILSTPTEGRTRVAIGDLGWYSAPECFRRSDRPPAKVSSASDIFSLGCVMAEIFAHMIGGSKAVANFRDQRKRYPTSAESSFCQNGKVQQLVWSWVEKICDSGGGEERRHLARLIRKLLNENREERLTAEQLAEDLEATRCIGISLG